MSSFTYSDEQPAREPSQCVVMTKERFIISMHAVLSILTPEVPYQRCPIIARALARVPA